MSDDEGISPALQEALSCLAEECAEVIQVCTKILRFGARVNPYTGEHNLHALERELGDLTMMIGVLNAASIINADIVCELATKKLDEVTAKDDGRFKHIFKYTDDSNVGDSNTNDDIGEEDNDDEDDDTEMS